MTKIPQLLEKALDKMLRGKKVRFNDEGREYWKDTAYSGLRGDNWHYIQAINADGTLKLCSESHVSRDGVDLEHILWN